MIAGTVDANRDPIVRLRLRGASGLEMEVDAVVDTGFHGALAVPPAMVTALRLVWESRGQSRLADGTIHEYDVHVVDVEWGSAVRTIPATAMGFQPLVGMKLLDGHELRVEARVGGAVEIRPLPPPP